MCCILCPGLAHVYKPVLAMLAGKLLGLHSGDGHGMWSLAYAPGQGPQHIFSWRTSHDVQLAPQLLALHSSESGSFYSIVNAHTGKEVGSGRLGFLVSQVGASCAWCFLFLLLLFGNLCKKL